MDQDLKSKLERAKELLKFGFHVFPLNENSKIPAIKGFPKEASFKGEILENWWKRDANFNIGISTTRFQNGAALVVVDVDNKGKKRGDETLLALELEGYEFPKTFEQTTPGGGRHLVYSHVEAVKQGVDVLGSGLDIRSKGGYIVAAGSTLDGKPYTDNGHPVTPAPQWIIDKCGKAKEKVQTFTATEIINRESALKRAEHYLLHEAPLSIKGQGGDQTAYKVAAKVKDFGLNANDALLLMLTHWNDRTTPGWSPERLKEKVDHAYTYGLDPIGVNSPEHDFKDIESDDEQEKKNISYLKKMNERFAIVYGEDGHSILEETVDEKGSPKRRFYTEQTLKRMFSTSKVNFGGKWKSWADAWLDWPERREYRGLCFTPGREPRNGYYNLWTGWAVEPIPYSEATGEARMGFDRFIDHARVNVCQGSEESFRWLMGYLAHLVQKPFERPLTTLVFKGRKGTGKNALIERVGKLLGDRQFLVAHNSRYLTSNFNGHLDSCLMLVLDEAFWSGEKGADSALKGITTAPEIMIERKGRDPYLVDNLVRLVIIGNERWLVPASGDERRYAVFQMGEGKMQQTKFFEEMRILMDQKGGSQVLLDHLLKFDLASVDVNVAPKGQALLEQKVASLEPFYQWWLECLQDGHISGIDFEDGWPKQIDRALFRKVFHDYVRARNIRSRIPDAVEMGHLLKDVLPNFNTALRRREGNTRVRAYRLPDLNESRRLFSQYIGQEMSWDESISEDVEIDPLS